MHVDSIDFAHPVNSEELDVLIDSLRKLEEKRKLQLIVQKLKYMSFHLLEKLFKHVKAVLKRQE